MFGDVKAEKDNSPLDPVNVNTFMLYFSDEEVKDVKRINKKICKLHNVGNVSDLFLAWMRKEEQNLNSNKDARTENIEHQESDDRPGSGEAEVEIPD